MLTEQLKLRLKLKQWLFLFLITLFIVGCTSNSNISSEPERKRTQELPKQSDEETAPTEVSGGAPAFLFNLKKKDIEELKKTQIVLSLKQGKIKIKLFPDKAPITCANFVYLAEKGFYNGTLFHRVVPNFVVQGGDPLSKDNFSENDGTGGPGYAIPAEFNDLPHQAGTVAMARSQDPDSAGSQFYICLSPQPQLDGNYTVFGQVIEGFELVSKIKIGDPITGVEVVKTK